MVRVGRTLVTSLSLLALVMPVVRAQQEQPAPQQQPLPNNDITPPQPTKAVKVLTLEQFASSFQPKAGNYEVSIINYNFLI